MKNRTPVARTPVVRILKGAPGTQPKESKNTKQQSSPVSPEPRSFSAGVTLTPVGKGREHSDSNDSTGELPGVPSSSSSTRSASRKSPEAKESKELKSKETPKTPRVEKQVATPASHQITNYSTESFAKVTKLYDDLQTTLHGKKESKEVKGFIDQKNSHTKIFSDPEFLKEAFAYFKESKEAKEFSEKNELVNLHTHFSDTYFVAVIIQMQTLDPQLAGLKKLEDDLTALNDAIRTSKDSVTAVLSRQEYNAVAKLDADAVKKKIDEYSALQAEIYKEIERYTAACFRKVKQAAVDPVRSNFMRDFAPVFTSADANFPASDAQLPFDPALKNATPKHMCEVLNKIYRHCDAIKNLSPPSAENKLLPTETINTKYLLSPEMNVMQMIAARALTKSPIIELTSSGESFCLEIQRLNTLRDCMKIERAGTVLTVTQAEEEYKKLKVSVDAIKWDEQKQKAKEAIVRYLLEGTGKTQGLKSAHAELLQHYNQLQNIYNDLMEVHLSGDMPADKYLLYRMNDLEEMMADKFKLQPTTSSECGNDVNRLTQKKEEVVTLHKTIKSKIKQFRDTLKLLKLAEKKTTEQLFVGKDETSICASNRDVFKKMYLTAESWLKEIEEHTIRIDPQEKDEHVRAEDENPRGDALIECIDKYIKDRERLRDDLADKEIFTAITSIELKAIEQLYAKVESNQVAKLVTAEDITLSPEEKESVKKTISPAEKKEQDAKRSPLKKKHINALNITTLKEIEQRVLAKMFAVETQPKEKETKSLVARFEEKSSTPEKAGPSPRSFFASSTRSQSVSRTSISSVTTSQSSSPGVQLAVLAPQTPPVYTARGLLPKLPQNATELSVYSAKTNQLQELETRLSGMRTALAEKACARECREFNPADGKSELVKTYAATEKKVFTLLQQLRFEYVQNRLNFVADETVKIQHQVSQILEEDIEETAELTAEKLKLRYDALYESETDIMDELKIIRTELDAVTIAHDKLQEALMTRSKPMSDELSKLHRKVVGCEDKSKGDVEVKESKDVEKNKVEVSAPPSYSSSVEGVPRPDVIVKDFKNDEDLLKQNLSKQEALYSENLQKLEQIKAKRVALNSEVGSKLEKEKEAEEIAATQLISLITLAATDPENIAIWNKQVSLWGSFTKVRGVSVPGSVAQPLATIRKADLTLDARELHARGGEVKRSDINKGMLGAIEIVRQIGQDAAKRQGFTSLLRYRASLSLCGLLGNGSIRKKKTADFNAFLARFQRAEAINASSVVEFKKFLEQEIGLKNLEPKTTVAAKLDESVQQAEPANLLKLEEGVQQSKFASSSKVTKAADAIRYLKLKDAVGIVNTIQLKEFREGCIINTRVDGDEATMSAEEPSTCFTRGRSSI